MAEIYCSSYFCEHPTCPHKISVGKKHSLEFNMVEFYLSPIRGTRDCPGYMRLPRPPSLVLKQDDNL